MMRRVFWNIVEPIIGIIFLLILLITSERVSHLCSGDFLYDHGRWVRI